MIAETISHYRILRQLGAGGMGEVYLAEDTNLDRKVAIKFLPTEIASDEPAKRRLVREAKAAATLDHPNICAVHEVGEEDGRSFIVMQYVEGETLAAFIKRKPLSINLALDIATQVADGLVEAHSRGILHRDIKPQNIMITPRGQAKVMDFGLAKVVRERSLAESEAETESLLTEPGVILGTVPYMSPEQVRCEIPDVRSDIFSFGAVLYEIVTGHQSFSAESTAATFSSILTREPPPLARYSREVPAELERIVRKTLHKDREERYQTARDLLVDLKNLKHNLEFDAERSKDRGSSGRAEIVASAGQMVVDTAKELEAPTGEVAAARTTSSVGYLFSQANQHKRAVALALGAIAALAALWYFVPRPGSGTKEVPTSLRNATFTQLTDQPGPEYSPSLSPDGKSFVYGSYAAGNRDIYLQRVGGKNPVNLTKDSPSDDTQPAFSPDGERIAFRSEREGGGVFVMGATGESVKRLTDFGYNPVWSPDGKEIACADEGINNRIWAVNVATGERRLVTKEDSVYPNCSPHGVRIAYQGRRKAAQYDIWTIPAGGGEPVEVTNDAAGDQIPVWSPDGKYLYFASDRGGTMNLWRVPIEEQTGKVLGQPEAVTTPSPYTARLSFSKNGRRMVYAQTVSRTNLQQVGFDAAKETVTGQPVWITQGSRRAVTPDLSPDGEWLAFDSSGGQQEDLFVIRKDGTGLRQLTDDIYKDRRPKWSPDGKRIAFDSDRSGKWEIWTINSDGSGLQQLTFTSGTVTNPVWSPDGTRLAYRNAGGSPSIMEFGKPWQGQSPQSLPPMSDSNDWVPYSWSPDGRRLAGGRVPIGVGIVVYSLESQQYEKLTDFGSQSVWLSDSRRLLFPHQGKLYLVDSQSKKIHEVLSVAPYAFISEGFSLSRDNRQIYFSLITNEADIWLMTME